MVKIRIGFVSNSSSASFVVSKEYLTPEQIDKIWNHPDVGEEMGIPYSKEWAWDISEREGNIYGEQYIMDNFNMEEFLEKIGVGMSKVNYKY
jgi:hypothetical protein